MGVFSYLERKKEEAKLDNTYVKHNKLSIECHKEVDLLYKKFKKKSKYKTEEIEIYKELKRLYVYEEKAATFAGVKYLPINLMIAIASSMITITFFNFTNESSFLNLSVNTFNDLLRQSNNVFLLTTSIVFLFLVFLIALSLVVLPTYLYIFLTDKKARNKVIKLNLIIQILDLKISEIENKQEGMA